MQDEKEYRTRRSIGRGGVHYDEECMMKRNAGGRVQDKEEYMTGNSG